MNQISTTQLFVVYIVRRSFGKCVRVHRWYRTTTNLCIKGSLFEREFNDYSLMRGNILVEERTARELKMLLNELVDHSYGHHKAIHGLMKRVEELERKMKNFERRE